MNLSNDNIIHIKDGEVEYLQFKRLLEFKDLVHAYCLKPLNFRSHSNKNNINDVYENMLNKLGLKLESLVRPEQTHTNNVLTIKEKVNKSMPDINLEYLKDVDGTITATNNVTLAATNADCIIMMFYDPVKKVIANVHSGWRGTFKKIAKVTAIKMKQEHGCAPQDIIVCICPSIRMCHFEVQDDVKVECEKIFRYTNRIHEIIKKGEIKEDKQRYYIDTVLITKILLEEEGIEPENIIDSGICSVCHVEKVHSRRADGIEYGLRKFSYSNEIKIPLVSSNIKLTRGCFVYLVRNFIYSVFYECVIWNMSK